MFKSPPNTSAPSADEFTDCALAEADATLGEAISSALRRQPRRARRRSAPTRRSPTSRRSATRRRSSASPRSRRKRALALTHLALAGVGHLNDPREDARRLFIADGLMKAGVPPATILAALGDAPPPDALDRAYNPDQPRVPAGNGRPSGQWTSGDWSDETSLNGEGAPPPARQSEGGQDQGVQIADASDDWL